VAGTGARGTTSCATAAIPRVSASRSAGVGCAFPLSCLSVLDSCRELQPPRQQLQAAVSADATLLLTRGSGLDSEGRVRACNCVQEVAFVPSCHRGRVAALARIFVRLLPACTRPADLWSADSVKLHALQISQSMLTTHGLVSVQQARLSRRLRRRVSRKIESNWPWG